MERNNPFIGKFVNEMYAILLGIGISNIIFVQEIDLKNISDVALALFVVTVALIYWWDWTESIEHNIHSTKLEFVIDFSILINIQILFAYFNDPEKLILAFISLSILDLFWVMNYLYIVKLRKSYSNNNPAKWLSEKLFVSLLYIVIFWFISTTNSYTLFLGFNTDIILVILAFIIARNFGFKQVQNSNQYHFLKAEYNDIDSIVSINNSYFEQTMKENNNGFLLKKLTIQDVINSLSTFESQFFVVKNVYADTVGFVEIRNGLGDLVKNTDFYNESDKVKLTNNNVYYIEQIAIDKKFSNQGIGTFIYTNLFKEYENTFLASFVMDKPISNFPSIQFHKKMDFKNVGLFKKEEFLTYHNYESLLFVKDLKGYELQVDPNDRIRINSK